MIRGLNGARVMVKCEVASLGDYGRPSLLSSTALV